MTRSVLRPVLRHPRRALLCPLMIVRARFARSAEDGLFGWSSEEFEAFGAHPPHPLESVIGQVDGMYVRIRRPQHQEWRYVCVPLFYAHVASSPPSCLSTSGTGRSTRRSTVCCLSSSVTGGWDAFVRCRPVGRQGTLRNVLSSRKCPSSSAATYEAALRNNRVCVFCHPALCSLCLKVFLIGDGAYDGDSRVLVPYRGNDLDERQRRFNKVLRSERFLVEWVIGRVRTTWFVLAARPWSLWRAHSLQLSIVLAGACSTATVSGAGACRESNRRCVRRASCATICGAHARAGLRASKTMPPLLMQPRREQHQQPLFDFPA